MLLYNGEFYITNFDANNHYETNILRIEKWEPHKVWTAVLYDADNEGYPYVKRFLMEAIKKHQNYLGDNVNSKPILLTDVVYPRLRISTFNIDKIEELEPTRFPEAPAEGEGEDADTDEEDENLDPDAGKTQQQVIDEITGQLNLFPDE